MSLYLSHAFTLDSVPKIIAICFRHFFYKYLKTLYKMKTNDIF